MNDNRFYIRAALCSALLCAVSFAAVGCSCREKKEPQNEPPVAENAQNEEEPQFPDYPKDSAKERENESSKDADSDQTQEKNGNHAKEEKYESGEQGETDGNAGNQDGSKGNAGGQGGSNGSAGGQGGSNGSAGGQGGSNGSAGGQGGSNGSAGGQGGSNGSAGGQGGSNGSAGNDNAESGSQGEKRGKGSKGKEQSQGKNFGGSIGDFFNDFFELGSDSEERSGDDPSDSGVENVQGGAYDDSDYISTGSFNRKRGKRALKDLEKELESAKRSLEREEYEDAFVAANDLISGIREFEYQRLGADGQGKDVDRFKALLKEANQLAEEAGNMIDSVKCSEEAQIFEF